MLSVTWGASLVGNLLTSKGAIATSQGRGIQRAVKGKGEGTTRAGEWIVRAGHGNNSNNKMEF